MQEKLALESEVELMKRYIENLENQVKESNEIIARSNTFKQKDARDMLNSARFDSKLERLLKSME